MTANPADYVSASEAARILGVSRQRISTMVADGDLPAVRPWPRAVRIPRAALQAWLDGERRPFIGRPAVRAYVLDQSGAMTLNELSLHVLREHCSAFIGESRPTWTADERTEWARAMSERLAASN